MTDLLSEEEISHHDLSYSGCLQLEGLERELPNVHLARVDRAYCSEQTGRCTNADAGGIYYYDNNHVSKAGARLAAPIIVAAIKAASAGPR